MNITWGFINASQQTPKIMKARSGHRRRQLLEFLFLCLLSICLPEKEAFDHSSAGFSCSLHGMRSPGRLRSIARAGSFATQMNWVNCTRVGRQGGAAHTVQCLQNMEIINLIELVKYHQCYKRGFEHGLGMRPGMIAMGWIDADVKIKLFHYCFITRLLQVYFW